MMEKKKKKKKEMEGGVEGGAGSPCFMTTQSQYHSFLKGVNE